MVLELPVFEMIQFRYKEARFMKVIVVGCTHAGTAAVKTMLEKHEDLEVTVYERNDNVSFLSCGIALYIGEVIEEPESLFYSNPLELKELGANVNMEHDVLDIDTKAKVVKVKNLKTGDVFEDSYDKLVLTTGSWPIIPPFENKDGENILLCKNYRQAQEIFKRKQDAENVVIVGAGYIGIELVEAFANTGKNVVLIDAMDRILNKYLDAEMTDILEDELQNRGVDLALGEKVSGFNLDENGKVKGVNTDANTYDADLVILCVGFRPHTELAKGKVDMLENGAIVVNEYMQTSDPDIFAGGDSVAVHYNPNGKHAYIPLATNAVRMGSLIGKNIKGGKVRYRGTQGTSGLYLFGYNIGSSGVTEESAAHFGLDVDAIYFEDWYRPEFMPSNERIHIKLVYEKETGRIVGGQLMSRYDITQSANTLSVVIQSKMTIEDLAYTDFFFQPHFDRPWNYLNLAAHEACEKFEEN